MKLTKAFQLLFVLSIGFLSFDKAIAQVWNPNHAIGTIDGNYNFSYLQTPSQLAELHSAAIPNTGLDYQWESSTMPLSGFTSISGAVSSSYSIPGPLTQTTYYRRKTTYRANGFYIHSNTIKISVVSVRWEDRNYVKEHTILSTGAATWTAIDGMPVGQKLESATYLDGLGRTVEKVNRETATPSNPNGLWGDFVQFTQFDAYGKQPISYLPYTTTTESGKYKSSPLTEQPQYYTSKYNEGSAYLSLTFDNSPLYRVTNMKEPGTAWANSAGKSISYDLNEGSDNVRIFSVDYIQGNPPVVGGIYPANTLYKTAAIDENGKKVIVYTNKSGQTILKKVQMDDAPSASHFGWICTYFVYDDFGLLRYELSPEAVKYLDENSWSFAGTSGQQVLNGLCTQYNYDDKGRMIWKQTPGAAPLNMVYDVRDRLAFTQDGNQGDLAPQWTVNLYDELDRPILTTLYNSSKSAATIKSELAAAPLVKSIVVSNSANNGGSQITIGASLTSLTSTDLNNSAVTTTLKYAFYDDYTYPNVKSFNTGFTNLSAYSTSDPNVQALATSSRTLSMLTGSKTRVLGSNTFLNTTSYYDNRGSLIQTLADNIKSGTDITTLQYHFDGRILSSCTDHTTSNTGYTNFKILTKYLFDKIGRVTSIQKQFGSNAFKTISSYDYDDVGRIKTKHLDPGYAANGGSELESLNYTFNIHNQLTGINKDYALKTPGSYSKWSHFFGMYLGYNQDNVFTQARLNGQIAGVVWNTQGDDAQRKYEYDYDNANRLSKANFTEQQHTGDGWASNKMDFSVSGYTGKITYDLNGNLLSLLHKGVAPGTTAPIVVDDLRYSYASYSNKLQSVTDQMTTTNLNGTFGDFKDGSNGTNPDYVYDNNGNVVIDLNKNVKDLNNVTGANGVHYNFLDKPDQIRIAGKGTITIVYSGDGQKLQRIFTPETGTATTTTYINQFVYQASGTNPDVLSFITFEEGRLRAVTPTSQNNGYDLLTVDGNMDLPNGKKGVYDYFILDYQQNVRMVLSEEIHTASNTATMETSRASVEESIFGQSGAANEVLATRYNKPSGWTGNTSSLVSRLGNIAGRNIGPNTLQKVMAGDKISTTVQYYYNQPASGSNSSFVSNLVSSLFQALSGGPTTSLVKGSASNVTNQLSVNTGFINAVQPSTYTGPTPLAYLTVLFFDERFNFISAADGGVYQQQVASSVGSNGSSLTLSGIKAPKNGYVYAYISNQSDQDVYFDNFAFTLAQGNIIEENHYYSFGLKIAAISSKKYADSYDGDTKNNYQMQGAFAEMDDDIGWNDFALRNYDPQIGRWVQQDPFQQFASPYLGMGNDPVNLIDPSGGIGIPCPGTSALSIFLENAVYAIGNALNLVSPVFDVVGKVAAVTQTATVVINAVEVSNTVNGQLETNMAGASVNVLLFITGADDTFEKNVRKSNGLDIGQWHVIVAVDIYAANKSVASYLKGKKVDNLILSAHGSSGGIDIGASGRTISNNTLREYDDTNCMSNEEYERWVRSKGRSYQSREKAGDVENFYSLLNKVNNGGHVVITGCNAGYGTDGADLGSQVVNGRNINLYLNQDKSSYAYEYDIKNGKKVPTGYGQISGYKGRLTDPSDLYRGWVKFKFNPSSGDVNVLKGKYQVIIGGSVGTVPVQYTKF